MGDVIVRASSLPAYPDCSRRSAGKLIPDEIKAAGYEIRNLRQGVGAAIGTAVHAAAKLTLDEKTKSGNLPPSDVATDIAVSYVNEALQAGVLYDKATLNLNDAQIQASRMARMYHAKVAPKIEPMFVEQRFEAVFVPGIILSGQSDVLAREPGKVRDLKTGQRESRHAAQIGAYSLLSRSHGYDIQEACVDFIPRVAAAKPQPEPTQTEYEVADSENAAVSILRHIEHDIKAFREGDASRGLLPQDPWAFPANPNSFLCSEKFCPFWGVTGGGAFCKEWRPKKEK